MSHIHSQLRMHCSEAPLAISYIYYIFLPETEVTYNLYRFHLCSMRRILHIVWLVGLERHTLLLTAVCLNQQRHAVATPFSFYIIVYSNKQCNHVWAQHYTLSRMKKKAQRLPYFVARSSKLNLFCQFLPSFPSVYRRKGLVMLRVGVNSIQYGFFFAFYI